MNKQVLGRARRLLCALQDEIQATLIAARAREGRRFARVAAVTAELPLINLSKETANATLYYGKGGFEARVSMSYRDSYLRIVPGLNGQDADGMDSGTYIDASASYRLNDHVQFTLEGQNLGDTYEHTFNDSVAQRNEYYRNFGRQYTLGVRFNY